MANTYKGSNHKSFHGYADHIYTLRQYSRGNLKIKSANPHQHPAIDPKSLSHPEDLPQMVKARVIIDFLHDMLALESQILWITLVEAVKQTRELYSQDALKLFQGDEIQPGPEYRTDKQLENWLVNHGLETCYHPVSTCKIGQDDLSPVDTNFRIKGRRLYIWKEYDRRISYES